MRGRLVAAAGVAAVLVLSGGSPAYADGIRDEQWHLGFLDVAAAHRFNQGAGVTVAVIDSGVDGTHPDLAGSLLPAVDATRVPEATTQSDVDGRGTGLAGLIAGHGHGAVDASGSGVDGVLGIAPRARILPIVITTRPGQFGDPDVLADGIDLAVARGAQVICIGRGMPSTPRLEQSVAAAVRADVVVVATTAGRPGEPFLPWPAAYPGVLGVAPLGRTGVAVSASTATPSAPANPSAQPAISAPGVDLITTDTRGGYRIDAGAGAAAIVAGAVALVRSRFPQLAGEAVVARLTGTTADRAPAGRDSAYGHGVLDVVAALTTNIPVRSPLPAPSPTGAPAVPTAVASPSPQAESPPRAQPDPAFSSGDWRRWLVAVPLLGFFVGLVFFAMRMGGGRAASHPR